MVEEFMPLANITVARETTRAFPACVLRHPAPTPGSFDGLARSLAQHGHTLDASSSLALTASLDSCVDGSDPYFNKSRDLATRCMQQARYFVSGAVATDEYFHYGLAAPIYTHFTSPIRRYADQVRHRLLAAIIGWEPVALSMLDPDGMGEVVDNMNIAHDGAVRGARLAGCTR